MSDRPMKPGPQPESRTRSQRASAAFGAEPHPDGAAAVRAADPRLQSAPALTRRGELVRRAKDLPHRWLEIAAAAVFWCLLWTSFGPGEILGGIVVGVLLALIFPLPLVSRELTLRPVAAVVLVTRFLADMGISALQVAWYAIRPSGPPASSVLAVQLRSRSDLFLTFTAMACTLVPGSVVVEAQRSTGTIFLHVIGADSPAAVEKARKSAQEQELRILRALANRRVLEDARSESECAVGSSAAGKEGAR